jgi:hypothetical protein
MTGCRVPVLRLGGPEVGTGLRLQPFGHRIGHPLARGVAGRLEGECGEPEPGDADRPPADHVGYVVHAEQDPADPDQRDQRGDR